MAGSISSVPRGHLPPSSCCFTAIFPQAWLTGGFCGGVQDMNLSHLAHHNRRLASQGYFPSSASHLPSERVMASALTANTYLSHQPIFVGAPQHPPSPPVEDLQKCTLPSIQSLIGDMAGSPASSSSRQSMYLPSLRKSRYRV